MLIWKDRQELRLETVEKRLRVLERAWHSISKPDAFPNRTVNARDDFLNLMRERLNEEELKDLVFSLNIDYESLAADGKAGKARELFVTLENKSRLYMLYNAAKNRRPDVDWPAL